MRQAAVGKALGGAGLIGFLALGSALAPAPAQASDPLSPIGTWRTIDDRTNKPDGVVQIYEANGALYGRVTRIDDPKLRHALCHDCGGYAHDKPVMGLVVMLNMRPNGDGWAGGTVLNPQNGEIYHCRMHLVDDGEKLVVRGYVGTPLFGRTQTWERLPDDVSVAASQ